MILPILNNIDTTLKKILAEFPDTLLFISPGYRIPDLVISKKCLETKTLSKCVRYPEIDTIKKVAEILRKCVLEKIDSTAEISWPPSVDELQSGERKAPEPLNTFYQTLLGFKTKTEKSVRIIESFCADILYTISNGRYTTLKHTSLGLGIHSMTGMKTPITFLHRLGHSIS